MPKDKDFKRRVRDRVEQPIPLPADYATLAGHSDEMVQDRTGRTWPEWVHALDEAGAIEMAHAEIARWVHEQTGLGWWSQAVTVGYERIRGLRDVGQRRDGGYEANKSRTIHAPVAAVFQACTDHATRRRWLDLDVHVRGSTPGKSVRFDWPDGTDVVLWLDAKAPQKTVVAVQHGKLPSAEDKESAKAAWADRLGALKALVE